MPNPENLIPAKKGEVRNPNGRGKGVPNSATRYKRLLQLVEKQKNPVTGKLENFTVAEVMDMAQMVKARKGDTRAYEVILDRLEGRPAQSMDVTSAGEKIEPIVIYTPEKLPEE